MYLVIAFAAHLLNLIFALDKARHSSFINNSSTNVGL